MSDKKRKMPETNVPEAAYGAGKAGKYKVKSQGAKGISRKGVEKSTIRYLSTPPPKRDAGDIAMISMIERELNKSSKGSRSQARRHRKAHS